MTQPGFGEQLRYVGRDGATGLPARVNDTFIAETEKAIERYGQDAGEPVPPPPGYILLYAEEVAGVVYLRAMDETETVKLVASW